MLRTTVLLMFLSMGALQAQDVIEVASAKRAASLAAEVFYLARDVGDRMSQHLIGAEVDYDPAEWDEVIRLADEAVVLNPHMHQPRSAKLFALVATERKGEDEIRDCALEILEVYADDIPALVVLVEYHRIHGNDDQVLQYKERALEVDPGLGPALDLILMGD
ncbi:MAG: hypothetical protein FKY71_16160 [Spiribacter salinus]|uniref:Tetratricopeptide repeat protein n=1 Tax=Spiribacter salinus TaxID=1335746 RepID=A0A540VKM3_9GAMM|nr:MAG: hypothetical protein FKY71_16160 [Spiribacter salinus]